MLTVINQIVKEFCFVWIFLGIQLLSGVLLATNPIGTNSVFVNADALRRDNAAAQMAVFEQARSHMRNHDRKAYKAYTRKYRTARYLYRKYKVLAEITEERIRTFYETHRELHAHINSLTAESGEKVLALIGYEKRATSRGPRGLTYIRYELHKRSQTPVLIAEEESVGGILLLNKHINMVKISLTEDGGMEDIRHELGHFEVAVAQSRNYYRFLLTYGVHAGHGHHRSDPSCSLAEAYEARN